MAIRSTNQNRRRHAANQSIIIHLTIHSMDQSTVMPIRPISQTSSRSFDQLTNESSWPLDRPINIPSRRTNQSYPPSINQPSSFGKPIKHGHDHSINESIIICDGPTKQLTIITIRSVKQSSSWQFRSTQSTILMLRPTNQYRHLGPHGQPVNHDQSHHSINQMKPYHIPLFTDGLEGASY